MLDLTLGTGIAVGSFFLGTATVVIVWVNNAYAASKRKSEQQKGARKENGETPQNGYIRRGEHDKGLDSLHRRLDDMHKENRNWWKELDDKVDRVFNELEDQRKAHADFRSRLTSVETFQKYCPARAQKVERDGNSFNKGETTSG